MRVNDMEDNNAKKLYESEENVKVRRNTKKAVIGIVLLVVVGLSLIPLFEIFGRQSRYEEVSALMSQLNRDDVERVEALLDSLPDGYEDTDTMREVFADVQDQLHIVSTGDTIEDHHEIREAFFDLKALDDAYEAWDLSDIIDSTRRVPVLLGHRFEDSQHYFEFSSDAEGKLWLHSNLPGFIPLSENYYLYFEAYGAKIGFERVSDRRDRAIAFEIMAIEVDSIEIYTAEDGVIRTLYKIH